MNVHLFGFWLHSGEPVGPARVIPPPRDIGAFAKTDPAKVPALSPDDAWGWFDGRDLSDHADMCSARPGMRLECTEWVNAKYVTSTWRLLPAA